MTPSRAASTAALQPLIDEILDRLAQDKRVRRSLPFGGRIHLDRRLPFLCVHRQLDGDADPGTEQLITAETSYLTAPASARHRKSVALLVRSIAAAMAAHFGNFLVIEIWADANIDPRQDEDRPPPTTNGELILPAPGFQIHVRGPRSPRKTLETLAKALRKIRMFRNDAEVEIRDRSDGHPPALKPLISPADANDIGCHVLGVAVRPIYRDSKTGQIYPQVVRRLRRGMSQALKQAFFTFARNRTNISPEHYYAFGRRAVVKAAFEVDHQLAEVDDAFDLLLQATPVNAESAWREFRRSRFDRPPVFHYRPLAFEPAMLKRRLFLIPIEKVEDPTLAFLFRQKQDELDRRITLLADIGTPRFLHESLQIYGRVSPSLLGLARDVLDRVPTRSGEESARGQLSAEQFARRVQDEYDYYKKLYSEFEAEVNIREDMYSGMMVSRGRLLIGGRTKVPVRRAEALIQHEVGTHLVTYFNGRAQPFRQLDVGLAGYDGLQEGLAVLAEYLVGGLSRPRMRLLAARVVAAQHMLEGASFIDTFRLLDRTHEFAQRTAYTVTMRVYRGGGLTKDAVYLKGLVQILDYLKGGGDIEPLFIGKIAADHIALIGELRHRDVLRAPPLRPRYLDAPGVSAKLDALRAGKTVLDLMEGKKS